MRSLQFVILILVAFTAAWAEDPSAPDLNATGVELFKSERWDEALAVFLNAYDLAPDNDTIRKNLSNTYQAAAHAAAQSGEIADVAMGAGLLEEAITIDAENPAPLVQLGSYYLRLDNDKSAMFRLEEALELDPDNLVALELLGDAYYKSNDLAAALGAWAYVLQEQPESENLAAKYDKASREVNVEGNFKTTESHNFAVSFAPGTRRYEVSGVLRILEKARRDIAGRLGGVYPAAVTQVIVYTADDFSQATAMGEHVGALFDGKIRVPIEDRKGERLPQAELERRLYHEYTHVVVKTLGDGRIPWWLNEGVAETLSRRLDADLKAQLSDAYGANAVFALADLEESQLGLLDPEALGVAYRQSHATVDYLITRYGRRKFVSLLNIIAEGAATEDALKLTYRRRYSQIELEVAQMFPRG